MIEYRLKDSVRPKRWWRRKPLVLAVFSFRYDVHLIPDLLANLEPIVDGWVSFDDRGSREPYSDERGRRRALINTAFSLDSRWILAVDPDERFEVGLADAMRRLISPWRPTAWTFNLREMYSENQYRVDGIWGDKRRIRLFSVDEGQGVSGPMLHGQWFPENVSHNRRHTGLNLYHLRMINPERRRVRRDIYKALDPENRYQRIGYDYLADEEGVRLEFIPPGREFRPVHVDDGGLWSVSADTITHSRSVAKA